MSLFRLVLEGLSLDVAESEAVGYDLLSHFGQVIDLIEIRQ